MQRALPSNGHPSWEQLGTQGSLRCISHRMPSRCRGSNVQNPASTQQASANSLSPCPVHLVCLLANGCLDCRRRDPNCKRNPADKVHGPMATWWGRGAIAPKSCICFYNIYLYIHTLQIMHSLLVWRFDSIHNNWLIAPGRACLVAYRKRKNAKRSWRRFVMSSSRAFILYNLEYTTFWSSF